MRQPLCSLRWWRESEGESRENTKNTLEGKSIIFIIIIIWSDSVTAPFWRATWSLLVEGINLALFQRDGFPKSKKKKICTATPNHVEKNGIELNRKSWKGIPIINRCYPFFSFALWPVSVSPRVCVCRVAHSESEFSL